MPPTKPAAAAKVLQFDPTHLSEEELQNTITSMETGGLGVSGYRFPWPRDVALVRLWAEKYRKNLTKHTSWQAFEREENLQLTSQEEILEALGEISKQAKKEALETIKNLEKPPGITPTPPDPQRSNPTSD